MSEEVGKCQNCRHLATSYLTGYDGAGIYEFAYCNKTIVLPKVVDADADRQCPEFERKEEKDNVA